MILHTIGYEGLSISQFVARMAENQIPLLIDVRDVAWSHKPGFTGSQMEAELARADIAYIHADFAGNPKWLRSVAESHAESLSLYRWYLEEFPEVLDAFDGLTRQYMTNATACVMCFEKQPEDCHRSILAEHWRTMAARRSVVHL